VPLKERFDIKGGGYKRVLRELFSLDSFSQWSEKFFPTLLERAIAPIAPMDLPLLHDDDGVESGEAAEQKSSYVIRDGVFSEGGSPGHLAL